MQAKKRAAISIVAVGLMLCSVLPAIHAVTIDDEVIRDQFGVIWSKTNSPSAAFTSVAFSPTNGWIVASRGDNATGPEVLVFDNSGTYIKSFDYGSGFQASSVSISPNGSYLAYGGTNNNIEIYNLLSGAFIFNPGGNLGAPVTSLAFSPDGKYLAVGLGTGGAGVDVKVFDTTTWANYRDYGDPSKSVTSVVFSSNGTWVGASQMFDGVLAKPELFFWDLREPSLSNPQASYDYTDSIFDISMSVKDSAKAFIGGNAPTAEGQALSVWPSMTILKSYNIVGSNDAISIALSSDENKLALGCNDNLIHIFNATTGVNFANLTGHSGIVNSVAWSPDGKYIASAGADGKLILWGDKVAPVVASINIQPTPPINATKRAMTVTVDFNESMDTSVQPLVSIGLAPNHDAIAFTGSWMTRKAWQGTATIPIANIDGQNKIRAKLAKDLSGNLMSTYYSTQFTVDTVAPVSTASTLPQYENSTNFNVSASANDATSGVKEVELWFMKGSGAWTFSSVDTSAPWNFTFSAAQDDIYTFETIARDNANNTEPMPVQNDTWTIVDTAPPASMVKPIEKIVKQWNVTVEADASDKNGVKEVELWYKKDGGAWTRYANDTTPPYRWDFNASGIGQGTYELASRARDVAGNHEPLPLQNDTWVIFDLGLPETSVAALPLYSTSRKVGLTIDVQKDAGGIDHFEVWTNDGSGWKRAGNATNASYAYSAAMDGVFAFYSIGVAKSGAKEVAPAKNDTYTIVDTVAPTASMTSPKDGETNVALDSNVTIAFSELMNTGSVSLTFESAKGPVQKAVTWSAGKTLTLDPKGDLLNGTKYYVNLTAGKDLAGNLVGAASWNFITVLVDSIPPKVTATYPANGSIVGPGITHISMTFSEYMDPATKDAVGIDGSATLTNPTWGGVVLNLTLGSLVSGRTYTVTVSAPKAKDLAGNPLQGDYEFEFTTMTPGKGGVKGTVVRPTGYPVQGARVEILQSGTKIGERTTDAQGRFEFLDLEPGMYKLRASNGNDPQKEIDVTITAGKVESKQIVIEATPVIDHPLPDWTLWLVIGIVLVIILLVLFALMRRRRRPEEENEKGFGEGPEERLEGVAERSGEPKHGSIPNLKVRSETPNMVTVEWESYPNDEGYIIYHSTDGKKYESLAELQKGVSSFTHKHLAPSSEHWYRMAILYSTGKESPRSKPVKCEAKGHEDDGSEK